MAEAPMSRAPLAAADDEDDSVMCASAIGDLDELNDNLTTEDNISLEVNFGDGSSCHASDISSISFQNIVLEDSDAENTVYTRPELTFLHSSKDNHGGGGGMRGGDSVSESSDSPLNDFPPPGDEEEDVMFSGQIEEQMKRHQGVSPNKDDDDDDDDSGGGDNTGTMKRNSKQLSVASASNSDDQSTNPKQPCLNGHGYSDDNLQVTENENENAEEGEKSQSQPKNVKRLDSEPREVVSKRNSLEIRNSIPVPGSEAAACEAAIISTAIPPPSKPIVAIPSTGAAINQGAVPKMLAKCSPGLARRQNDGGIEVNRDGSSSEREDSTTPAIDTTVISAQKEFEQSLRNGSGKPFSSAGSSNMNSLERKEKQIRDFLDSQSHLFNATTQQTQLMQPPTNKTNPSQDQNPPTSSSTTTTAADNAIIDPNNPEASKDVKNEYDYVKYARVQSGSGDSYVGMRLAFSNSSDSLSLRQSWSGGGNGPRGSSDEEHCLASSHEASPEKQLQSQTQQPVVQRMSKVNEDTLTEIPLNGGGSDNMLELPPRPHNFSLSPEPTECDSAEVESVLSEEEGKSSTSGMPVVEDGLSSSQGSDVEEGPPPVDRKSGPADLLKQRHKQDVAQQLSQAAAATEAWSRQQQQHQQQSKLQQDEEPIWVMRDTYVQKLARQEQLELLRQQLDEEYDEEVFPKTKESYVRKLQRQEEMRRVREEIERRQEADLSNSADPAYGEQAAVVDGSDNGIRGKHPPTYTRSNGKAFQSTKGFESDEDQDYVEEHDLHMLQQSGHHRRKRGGGYASVPTTSTDVENRKMQYPTPQYPAPQHPAPQYPGTLYQAPPTESKLQQFAQQPFQFSSTLPSSRYHPQQQQQQSSSYQQQQQQLPPPQQQQCNNPQHHHHRPQQQQQQPQQQQHFRAIPEQHERNGGEEEEEDDDEEEEENPENLKDAAYIQKREGALKELSVNLPKWKYFDTDEETDELLEKQYSRNPDKVDVAAPDSSPATSSSTHATQEQRRNRVREVSMRDPDNDTVLIEGVLFRARYLGSTTLISEGQPSKPMRMMQAQEAVGRIKAPVGENQPSTDVDLFVSAEKIMVLNTDLQEIMMDHALRTISYIADIGDILVIMARRGPVTTTDPTSGQPTRKRQAKVICHVFETDEAQLIAQSIGQAFQVAYMEFLKANGIDDPGLMKEMDYQEVLNQQEIYGEELYLFANKDMQKEVVVPKLKGEPLGIVIVESGWGSMVPTVVLANMAPSGAANRCGCLNIGDQIMSINGVSLVGLPLSTCQTYIKNAAKNQTVIKLNVVSCPPVVEVCIKRPDIKYQLGFSVQNGVICSLLRGGIAERGGVRVGHRIIEINSQSVVAVPHEKIVNMLASAVGEIHMKTMPTSIFRLITGQDTPHFI